MVFAKILRRKPAPNADTKDAFIDHIKVQQIDSHLQVERSVQSQMSHLKDLKVVCVGGGNGSLTLAGLAGTVSKNVSIYYSPKYERRAAELRDVLRNNGGKLIVHTKDAPNPTIQGEIEKVSTDASIVKDADIIIISLPGDKHELVIKEIAPYLQSQVICFLPGTSALDLKMIRDMLGARCESVFASGLTYAATKTLPWSTRTHAPGEMHIRGVKGKVEVTLFPSTSMTRFLVTGILDCLHSHPAATTNFVVQEHWLEATYIPYNYCGNPILHTGFMYSTWHSYAGEEYDSPPKFYHGATDDVINTLESLWEDLKNIELDLAGALGMQEPPNKLQRLRSMMYGKYADSISDPSSLLTTFKTNTAYKYTVHPMKKLENGKFVPNFESRQLTEDIPFGLVPMKGTAQLLGTATPTLDKVILWAQEKINKSYLVDGQLTGADVKHSGAPQRFGVVHVEDLLLYVPSGVLISNYQALQSATSQSIGVQSDTTLATLNILSAASGNILEKDWSVEMSSNMLRNFSKSVRISLDSVQE